MTKDFSIFPHQIISAQAYFNIKFSLIIRLPTRPTEKQLERLAEHLFEKYEGKKYQRVFMAYLLPGMATDFGAWATTHFDPKLKVNILGKTKEQYKNILAQVKKIEASQETIGSWMSISPITDSTFGACTFFRKDGKTYMTSFFGDESSGTDELIIQKVKGQTRYNQKSDVDPTEYYFIITASGDLGHCDEDGMWATSKKIR